MRRGGGKREEERLWEEMRGREEEVRKRGEEKERGEGGKRGRGQELRKRRNIDEERIEKWQMEREGKQREQERRG